MAYGGYNYGNYNNYPPYSPGAQQHSSYSFSPNNYGAAPRAAPEYGQPGHSFAGRRAMQPPGGVSSLNIYGNGNAPASKPAGYGYGYGSASYNYGGVQGYGNSSPYGAQDLSYQLNIPAGRGPPVDGRRAASQPNPPGYGMGYGAGQVGAGYGASSSPYSAYQLQSAGYGAQNQYGGSPASNGYGYDRNGPQSPKFNGNWNAGNAGMLAPSQPAPFHPGQKGPFGGKVITQPPGGRTSINLFG